LARFYQVQTGNRTGYLYRRCECGADQKTGAAVQVKWLKNMSRTDETMIPHPLDAARVQQSEPEPEPKAKTAEARAESEGRPKQASKKSGFIGVAALVGAVLVSVLT
jgi:hypothetical protein